MPAKAHWADYTHIANTATIAVDTNSTWTYEGIAAGQFDDRFLPITEHSKNLGFTTSSYWVSLSLTNTSDSAQTQILETGRPLTNEIAIYDTDKPNNPLLYLAGDDFAFKKRPITYRKFVFPITLQPNSTKRLLIKYRSDGEVINLFVKQWKPSSFYAFVQQENLTLGVYYGLILFVVLLFGFFAAVAHQRIYTYYVVYVAFLLLMQASIDGLAFEYLWNSNTWLANHSVLFFSSASVFMLMLYAGEYLDIQRMQNRFRTTYKVFQVLVLMCLFTSLFSGLIYEITFPLINGLSLLALITIIIGIVIKTKSNEKVNVFFTAGFLAVLIGGILFILTNFNLIENDFLSQNAIKLGSAAEVTFLSLAMVARYREVQKEKELAQKEAFERLEQINEITKDQNIKLELQVAERTAELKEKNEEIISSITYAKRIQTAILPPTRLLDQHLPNSFVLYKPKDIVAGDFYWMEAIDDLVFFAAADCTGHGVPGAMVSVICNNGLNRSVREFGLRTPAQILDKTRELVIKEFEKSDEEVKDGMDISLCAWDKTTNQVQWAGANNPLWIIRNEANEVEERKADKQPIGKYTLAAPFTNHEVQLSNGDNIYLFSDGFPDQFGGEKGKKYKSGNFKKLLVNMSKHPISEQRKLLDDEFETWRGPHEQIDDVCVIGLTILA